jgi:hypothetical protein
MVELTAEAGFSGRVVLPPAPAPLPERPRIRVGSNYDAKVLRSKIQALLAGVERAGDVLAALLDQARAKAIHLMLEAPGGGYFTDFTEFALCPAPHGLGMAPALIEVLGQERVDPRRRARVALESSASLRPRGGQPGRPPRRPTPTSSTEYALLRLKRDHPGLLQQVADGTLPSIDAAAKLAGLRRPKVHVFLEPMSVARLIVTRLDDAQQREVVDLVRCPERITAPAGGRCPHWDAYLARQERRSPER